VISDYPVINIIGAFDGEMGFYGRYLRYFLNKQIVWFKLLSLSILLNYLCLFGDIEQIQSRLIDIDDTHKISQAVNFLRMSYQVFLDIQNTFPG